jgi:hypothetical protein
VSPERYEVLYVGDSVGVGIASVYVGEDDLPDGSTAMRLDLATLAQWLEHWGRDGGVTYCVPAAP